MLRERIQSGVLLLIAVLAVVVAGVEVVALGVLVGWGIGLLEFNHLVARRGHRAHGGLMLLWMALFVVDRLRPEDGLLAPGAAILLIITIAWTQIRFRQGTANAFTGFALTLAGSFYIGWVGAHFIGIRALQDGLFWVLTVIFATNVADTAAYGVGRAIGRLRLAPGISPNKTWEGYIAGIVFSPIVTALFTLLWRQLGASEAVAPVHGVVIGLLAAVIGPLGDLGMSVLKRYASAKDSSNLIPGHGGILDRVDSLNVVGLLSYYYLTLFALKG